MAVGFAFLLQKNILRSLLSNIKFSWIEIKNFCNSLTKNWNHAPIDRLHIFLAACYHGCPVENLLTQSDFAGEESDSNHSAFPSIISTPQVFRTVCVNKRVGLAISIAVQCQVVSSSSWSGRMFALKTAD